MEEHTDRRGDDNDDSARRHRPTRPPASRRAGRLRRFGDRTVGVGRSHNVPFQGLFGSVLRCVGDVPGHALG
jgi:hypothetical protein